MEREEACDWYPTPNLRMCLGILQQQFRRVLVDYRHYNGSSRPMRCQSAETEWRDVRQATDQEIAEIRARAEKETGTAPDNSVCPVCGWPTGHCNVGCTATSHQRIKIGDRVRLAIGTNTMLPTDGWTVYKLPSPEWRSYGVKHDNGGDMSINAEYVVPV